MSFLTGIKNHKKFKPLNSGKFALFGLIIFCLKRGKDFFEVFGKRVLELQLFASSWVGKADFIAM